MSVAGFTPPKADLTTPSTGTSSGSFVTKEPDATRVKLDPSVASCSVPEPRSTAQLVSELRRCELSPESEAASGGVSGRLTCPAASAADDDFKNDLAEDSDLERVGSSSSSSSDWQPRPREATLQGQTFEEVIAKLNTGTSDRKDKNLAETEPEVEKLEKQAKEQQPDKQEQPT